MTTTTTTRWEDQNRGPPETKSHPLSRGRPSPPLSRPGIGTSGAGREPRLLIHIIMMMMMTLMMMILLICWSTDGSYGSGWATEAAILNESPAAGEAPLVDDNDYQAAATTTTSTAEVSPQGQVQHQGTTTHSDNTPSAPPAVVGQFTPRDLPEPMMFTQFYRNDTLDIVGSASSSKEEASRTRSLKRAHGSVHPVNTTPTTNTSSSSSRSFQHQEDTTNSFQHFSVLEQVLDAGQVQQLLALLRNYSQYDQDPDTVDGMPTYEIFVHSPDLPSFKGGDDDDDTATLPPPNQLLTSKILEHDPTVWPGRVRLRRQLQRILRPVLDQILTPAVRLIFPQACQPSAAPNDPSISNTDDDDDDRSCTPCYSLIRQYRYGQRQSHAIHYDGHAIVTVVVSLSDYGIDYRGGLYVSTGYDSSKQYLALRKGDAVVHRSTLLHGVQVWPVLAEEEDNDHHRSKKKLPHAERWSWILWYKDSTQCRDYSHTWFADCSAAGDPVCQHLHANKVGNIPGLSTAEQANLMVQLNQQAAHGGSGGSAVKMARAHLKLLATDAVAYNESAAEMYYRLAARVHNPDGHYGLASLLLMQLSRLEQEEQQKPQSSPYQFHQQSAVRKKFRRVVRYLEEAAQLGHPFAMFNLGMVHTFGYGGVAINTTLAAEWFEACGLPEGYYVASQQALSVGDTARQEALEDHARVMGYFAPWRKMARQSTGSGGAGGVDLNLPWPVNAMGNRPPLL